MYHCDVQFYFWNCNPDFQDCIRKIAPLPGFTHTFLEDERPVEQKEAAADVIFADFQESMGMESKLLKNLVSHKKTGGQLIILALKEQLHQLMLCELKDISDIWILPLSQSEIKFYFEKWQQSYKAEKDLWLTENYLDTTINSIPDLVWYKDKDGVHRKVNESFCTAVNKTMQQVEGRGHYYIWDMEPDEYAKGEYICMESEYEVMEKKETCVFDEKVKTKNGMRQFRTYKSPLFDLDGSVMGTVGVANDMTELRNMDVELDILLENIPFAMIVCDIDGNIIKVNRQFEETFQIQSKDMLKVDYHSWKKHTFSDIYMTKKTNRQEAVLKTDGLSETIFIIKESVIYDLFQNETGYFCLFMDVTQEKTFEQHMIKSANSDFLTGLYNRRYVYEYMEEHSGEPVSVFYLDLDNFKQINDIYGHQEGDRALILTTEILKECLPESMIARIGGDEFVIIWREACTEEQLIEQAEWLRQKLNDAYSRYTTLKQLSVSIGMASSIDGEKDLDTLIGKADHQMYREKYEKKR